MKTASTITLALIASFAFSTLASAAEKDCKPGFVWDKLDNQCTCDERR
ncbi:hypothetical protein [Shimia sp. SDUM112013]